MIESVVIFPFKVGLCDSSGELTRGKREGVLILSCFIADLIGVLTAKGFSGELWMIKCGDSFSSTGDSRVRGWLNRLLGDREKRLLGVALCLRADRGVVLTVFGELSDTCRGDERVRLHGGRDAAAAMINLRDKEVIHRAESAAKR